MGGKKDAMTAGHYSLLAALIFAFVAALQLVRAIRQWPVTIGTTLNPNLGELGCLRRCRYPCLARNRSVSSLRSLSRRGVWCGGRQRRLLCPESTAAA
jgi:hypothetical protein